MSEALRFCKQSMWCGGWDGSEQREECRYSTLGTDLICLCVSKEECVVTDVLSMFLAYFCKSLWIRFDSYIEDSYVCA